MNTIVTLTANFSTGTPYPFAPRPHAATLQKMAPRGQPFRPQPMDLYLEGHPPTPEAANFNSQGLNETFLLLRLRSSALPPRRYHRPLYPRGRAVPGAKD